MDHYLYKTKGYTITGYLDLKWGPVPATGPALDLAETENVFFRSGKSFGAEVGGYVPFYLGKVSWNFRNTHQTLFMGPILKVGMQSNDASVLQAKDGRRTHNFYAGGVRFGTLRFSHSSRRAPYLRDYIDITWGRWDNLALFRQDGSTDIPLRVELSLLTKVPLLPVHVGYTQGFGRGRDDNRFFIGIRGDLTSWLRRITGRAP